MKKLLPFFVVFLFVTIWGNIVEYTDRNINLDGKKYPFHKNVIIDTYSLQKHEKGNTRIELNSAGNAEEVYFYGIDMPEVNMRYKR